jgi:hypothetical protein
MKRGLVFFVAFLIAVGLASKLILFADLDRVPFNKENNVGQYDSPTGSYTLNLYLRGGAFPFSDHSYIGELIDNKRKESKVILWLAPSEKIYWANDETIIVTRREIQNGQDVEIEKAKIKVKSDTYDHRWD